MLEEILDYRNITKALQQVTGNKGAGGVDGMQTEELREWLEANWGNLRGSILEGSYRPSPVRKVEIPKPTGGTRLLGIPTVVDRLIGQAIHQWLSGQYEAGFSENSYGFREGRNAHQAVERAKKYLEEGKIWVVEMDLDKFFDRVNHDKLMGMLAKRITDKRTLKLIRAYLNSGIMEGGLVSARIEGTPQGSPLSPILSNILLDQLDQELEGRGHSFVRYADDVSLYVGVPIRRFVRIVSLGIPFSSGSSYKIPHSPVFGAVHWSPSYSWNGGCPSGNIPNCCFPTVRRCAGLLLTFVGS